MHHDHRRVRQKLKDEITVADRIQAVLIHAIEFQLARHKMAVDRERRSRERACAERQHVDALVAVLQALDITAEHRYIRHQMMGEQDRLRPLQMRIARHNRIDVRFGLLDQALLAA